jgi:hypothetical protein
MPGRRLTSRTMTPSDPGSPGVGRSKFKRLPPQLPALAFLAWLAAAVTLTLVPRSNDFDFLWYCARALLAGDDPYTVAHTTSPWPLYYPLPAVLLAVPLALLPLSAARLLWQLLLAGAFTWAMAKRGPYALWALLSGAAIYALLMGQITPLLVAGAVIPVLSWVLPLKPNSGLALFAGYPSRAAAIGGLAVVILSLAVLPRWPLEWLRAVRDSPHIVAPIQRPFGWVLLLAALRWRRPEARMLLALAVIPQNLLLHETVALALVPASALEMGVYVAGTWFALLYTMWLPMPVAPDIEPLIRALWPVLLAAVYLPALFLVLRRPNAV